MIFIIIYNSIKHIIYIYTRRLQICLDIVLYIYTNIHYEYVVLFNRCIPIIRFAHTHACVTSTIKYVYLHSLHVVCVSVCFPVWELQIFAGRLLAKGGLSASSQLICSHLANIIHPTRAVLKPSIVILEKITYGSIWHVHKMLAEKQFVT